MSSSLKLLMLWARHGRDGLPSDLQLVSGARIVMTDGGRVAIGRRCTVDKDAFICARQGEVRIGSDSYIGIGCVIASLETIEIGRYALIAEYVTIRDQDHTTDGSGPVCESGYKISPIRIGDNVWIGAKASILKGVSIGANAVIGASAVVTENIPDNAVAVGVPARVIKIRGRPSP